MKKYYFSEYKSPAVEIAALEENAILCQSDVDGNITIGYDNPFGDSEGIIS